MADLLPGVTLVQIPALPTATLNEIELYPCLVAPLYRVVTEKKVRDNGVLPVVSSGSPLVISYPVVDAGAIIDQSTVVVTLKNSTLKYLSPSTGAKPANASPTSLAQLNGLWSGIIPFALTMGTKGQTSQNNVFIDTNATFITSGVKTGDILTANAGGYSYIIETVVDENTLIFTGPINMTFTGTDTGYNITTQVTSWVLGSLYYTVSSTGISITSFVNGSGGTFTSAEIDISYRALRKDLTGLQTFTSLDQVNTVMETSSLQNKLGYFIANAVIPANGNVIAFTAYILPDDTSAAYLAALEDLMGTQTYMLVPLCDNLSDSDAVKAAYRTNVDVMSGENQSAFRILVTDPSALQVVKTLTSAAIALPSGA
jgi:hypothetical protein